MTRILKSLGVLAVALAAFTGTALAGNGNGGTAPGNSANAPGQVKQQQAAPAAAPAPAPTAAPAPAKVAPGQAKKSSSTPAASASKGGGSAAQNSPSTAGMKPTSATAKNPNHWTTAGAKPDVSKRYGNGTTAAQIATSRGAPAATPIYGPGNSQPHKVQSCAKANGHFVDVHAVKSYSTTACTTQAPTPATESQQSSVCGSVTTTTTTTRLQRGHAYGLLKHGKPLHSRTKTTSVTSPTGESCSTSQDEQLQSQSQSSSQASQTASQTASQVAAANVARNATGPAAAGGVLGATKTLRSASAAKPASAGRSGVLGAVTRASRGVAHGTLPFTGLPVWIVLLVALALVGAGLALRRHSSAAL